MGGVGNQRRAQTDFCCRVQTIRKRASLATRAIELKGYKGRLLRFAITMINSFMFCVVIMAITEALNVMLYRQSQSQHKDFEFDVDWTRCARNAQCTSEVRLQHFSPAQGRKFGAFLKLASTNNVEVASECTTQAHHSRTKLDACVPA